MPSQYILPNEYSMYGLPTSTDLSQVYQASLLIDAYLRRPEGLVWEPDYTGQMPCYMAGLSPTATYNSTAAISPGSSVVISVPSYITASADMIGEVMILDRAASGLVEACVITEMAAGQITVASVANAHSASCTLEFGLTIFEEKSVSQKRSIARTSRPPVRLLSGMGRYGYGRRTDQEMGMFVEVNLLAAIQAFGGPPMWVPFNISQASVSLTTREVWVPAGILLAYFSEVRLRYVSGYPQKSIPPIIKQAAAQLVENFQQNPELVGQLKSIGAGSTKIERFAPSQLDLDTVSMLNTYRINMVI